MITMLIMFSFSHLLHCRHLILFTIAFIVYTMCITGIIKIIISMNMSPFLSPNSFFSLAFTLIFLYHQFRHWFRIRTRKKNKKLNCNFAVLSEMRNITLTNIEVTKQKSDKLFLNFLFQCRCLQRM